MAYAGVDTATTNFDKTVNTLIRKTLEEELLPTLPHLMPGNFVKATFVKGSNSTMRFLRIPNLTVTTNTGSVSAGTAPWLEQGVAPTAQEFVFGYEEFSAYQAGQRLAITDVAMMENPLDLASEGSKLIARQAAETADEYVGRILAAGTNVLYAGAGNSARTDVGATDVLNGSTVRRAAANLRADGVPTFGGNNYRAIVHPAVVFDFEEDTDVGGWLSIAQYGDAAAIRSGEIGKYAGVSFYQSARARTFAAGGAGGVDVPTPTPSVTGGASPPTTSPPAGTATNSPRAPASAGRASSAPCSSTRRVPATSASRAPAACRPLIHPARRLSGGRATHPSE
jgi:N4-gp56 family major capsid protein